MIELSSNQVKFNHALGQACLGEPGEIVDKYILPRKFDQNIGFGPDPVVRINKKIVGRIMSYKFYNKKIVLLLKFFEPMNLDISWCKFDINPLFGSEVGNYFLLDQVIINGINIYESVNKKN